MNRHRFGRYLGPALVLLVASTSIAQTRDGDRILIFNEPLSKIRDFAGVFGKPAVDDARKKLEAVEKRTGLPTIVETLDTLQGDPIDEAARRRARRLGPDAKGLFILIAKKERRLDIIASKEYAETLTVERRQPIRDAFLAKFRTNDYDGGLAAAVKEIDALATAVAPKPPSPRVEERGPDEARPKPITRIEPETKVAVAAAVPSFSEPSAKASASTPDVAASGLILKNQIRLTLSGAKTVLEGAEKKAAASGFKMNIAVVDDGGHLLCFARMDGARPASANTALTKAITAATFRAPSGPVPAGTTTPDVLLNLSLQNAAAASGGKLTTLLGGVPIVLDGQVVGAVGVGGGTGEQDAEVARAGIALLTERLRSAGP